LIFLFTYFYFETFKIKMAISGKLRFSKKPESSKQKEKPEPESRKKINVSSNVTKSTTLCKKHAYYVTDACCARSTDSAFLGRRWCIYAKTVGLSSFIFTTLLLGSQGCPMHKSPPRINFCPCYCHTSSNGGWLANIQKKSALIPRRFQLKALALETHACFFAEAGVVHDIGTQPALALLHTMGDPGPGFARLDARALVHARHLALRQQSGYARIVRCTLEEGLHSDMGHVREVGEQGVRVLVLVRHRPAVTAAAVVLARHFAHMLLAS
jgi:hypothetical protein